MEGAQGRRTQTRRRPAVKRLFGRPPPAGLAPMARAIESAANLDPTPRKEG
jgi:hypothetical protein